MSGILLGLVLAGQTLVAAPDRPESGVERLHRMGVQCQDVFERPDCAIENFEKLIDEPTSQRELVTDAMLRLVDLYQSQGELERAQAMLRKFWQAGVKSRRRGHIPYSARYLPADLDMFFMAHVQDILEAPISRSLDPDTLELATTCDPARRQLLEDRRQWQRARRKAKEHGKTAVELRYEEHDRQLAYEDRARQREQQRDGSAHPPVFFEAACPLARALGAADLRTWTRLAGAMRHSDFRASAGVAVIPDLAAKLQAAEQKGSLVRQRSGVWVLPGLQYFGNEVLVATIDQDELVVAAEPEMERFLDGAAGRRRTMNRDVDRLLTEVPTDVDFFFVMTEQAMVDLGLGSMSKGRQAMLKALLPRPKGFQVAAVFHDYFGAFMRMPTDTPVKGTVVVNLARRLLESEEDDASETEAQFLRQLDISQTEDKRALLLSYVLSPAQIRELIE